MRKRLIQVLFVIGLIMSLSACTPSKPPVEFTPEGSIIQKGIVLQLEQTQQRLSQQLKTPPPFFEISKIEVKNNEPVFIENLAAYHLTGTYRLKLKLPHQEIIQKKNSFDLYLQRQAEGKTWRLLSKNRDNVSGNLQWSSYLIELDEPKIEEAT